MLITRPTLFTLLALACLVNTQTTEKRKNVLFLVADDMRPELGCFLGPDFPAPVHPQPLHTPNLDALASRSLLLKQAYVQQSVCSPSRTSLLTGRRPDTTHVYDLVTYFRDVGGNFTTIPQYFKQHGYRTLGMGKIFHPGMAASHNDDPPSWTDPYWNPPNEAYWSTNKASWIAVDDATRRKKPLPDEQTTEHALTTLKKLAANQTDVPFFLAVGFRKPHLPFVFPEEFLQLYPLDGVHVPDNQYTPRNMPRVAWSDNTEIRWYKDIHALNFTGRINESLPADVVRQLRRAYYSALSYTDSLVGQLLKTLRQLNLEDETIVSFWGDHGWQLGEHDIWAKKTNFELATHAPMMVRVPGLTDGGVVTEEMTEFVDLFPTLVEAAGLPSLEICPEDSSNVPACREGSSLMPLIKTPQRSTWKRRVFSQYPRPGGYMGYTMRTARYRYTEWVKFTGRPKYQPIWSENYGTELYDHFLDPEENDNRAGTSSYASVQAGLSKMLRAGWRDALPQEEHNALWEEHNAPADEHNIPSAEHNAPGDEQNVPSAESSALKWRPRKDDFKGFDIL